MLMRWPLVYVVLLFTVVQQASSQGVAVKSVSNNAIQQAYDSTLKVTVPEALYDAAASWYTNFLVDLIVDIPDDSQWAS